MSKTKNIDIRLKQAEAKFTRANTAYVADPSKQAAYRKAKKDLAMVRQEHAEQRHVPLRPGDGQVKLKAVAAKAAAMKKENK
jgi:hypothetical protein